MHFGFGLYSTKHERLYSIVSNNEPLVPTTQSPVSKAMPNIAVGGDRVTTQARSGKDNQNVTNVQAISLTISSKRLEITGLVTGQIIEIRPSRETSNTPSWAPVLSSTISVLVGGCIAAATSWWTSRNQARTALKSIAAQKLREEIKALLAGSAFAGLSNGRSMQPTGCRGRRGCGAWRGGESLATSLIPPAELSRPTATTAGNEWHNRGHQEQLGGCAVLSGQAKRPERTGVLT
jgi:hypothetical protein